MQKLIFLSILFLSTSLISFSQTQGVAYTAVGKGVATTFVTDYHSLGINSSALGWGTGFKDKNWTIGMTEFNLGIYSDSLNSEKLGSLYKAIRNEAFGKSQPAATWQQQSQNAGDYLRTGVSIDASYNWFGVSYQNEKLGGIAFNIQENYSWYSKLSADVSGIAFQGKLADYFDQLTVVFGTDTTIIPNSGNISDDTLAAVVSGRLSVPFSLSDVTNGSDIKFSWNRYYNIGYGRKLFGDSTFALYGGIAGRYIQSTAMFNFVSDDNGLSLSSSLSPNLDINYGTIANTNSSTFIKKGKAIPTAIGNGYGVDLSVSAILFKRVKLALAVNNIGSVTYKRNVYSVRDTIIGEISVDGLENSNITNTVEALVQDGGILNLVGEEKVTIANNANIRFGGSIDFGKKLSVGVDFVAPFDRDNPGGIQNAVYSVGGDFRPLKWLQLSAGYFGGGIYKHNVPVGINFILKGGTYEFGISSRDALVFFTKNSNSVSTAFGVMRVRF
tara:strand:- start:10832 stop:12328 length:1497 start_codon:yes stop_codon:yes gene_type:complete